MCGLDNYGTEEELVLDDRLHAWPRLPSGTRSAYGVRFWCTAYASVYGVRCQPLRTGASADGHEDASAARDAKPPDQGTRGRGGDRACRRGRARGPEHAQARG